MMRLAFICLLVAAGWLPAAEGRPSIMEQTPPLPPLSPPPVQLFRELLATNAAGRAAYLNGRPEHQRRLIEQKLVEYENLPQLQRELRLALTELRYYLLVFLNLDPSLRGAYWAQVPQRYRPLIAERLKTWDLLDRPTQQEFLHNESLLALLVRMENAPPMPEGAWFAGLPADRKEQLVRALESWKRVSPEQQQAMLRRFKQFFELSEIEQLQALAHLPPAQRLIPEKLLAAFSQLPKEQRDRCTSALHRFLSLSPAQQAAFLRNAALWENLSPEQRQALRVMVQQVPPLPPLPPGFLEATGATLGGSPESRRPQ